MAEPSRSPRVVAHRGLHAEHTGGARENTLAAITAALAAGLRWVEIDVRVTADGAVVLLHDDTLERLWGDRRPIGAVPLAQVRELGGGATRVPLLTEALDVVAGTGATLLIDMDDPDVAVPAAQVVAQHTPGAAITAWCGHPEAMRRVRQVLPDAAVWRAWYSPEPPSAEDVAGVCVVNAQHLLVGAAFVEAVHAAGAEVAVWTVAEPAQAVHLAAIGVDSITSDHAPAVRDALRAGVVDERARQTAIARELAGHAAAATARARHDGVGTIEVKTSPGDHVTEIDRGIEDWVRAVLGAQFPEHDVVGEERGGTSTGDRPCWYLDPVDGTANLANGVPWTSFSLALVESGRPVVAAVLDPVGAVVDGVSAPVPVVAVEGGGAWRLGRRLATVPRPGVDPLAGAIVVTELDGVAPWPGLHPMLDALAARHCTVRVPGSGTASLAGVALGRGVAALVHRYQPIDHAAAVLVAVEAGGVVLDETGAPSRHPLGGGVVVGADEAAARALWQVWRTAVAAASDSSAGAPDGGVVGPA